MTSNLPSKIKLVSQILIPSDHPPTASKFFHRHSRSCKTIFFSSSWIIFAFLQINALSTDKHLNKDHTVQCYCRHCSLTMSTRTCISNETVHIVSVGSTGWLLSHEAGLVGECMPHPDTSKEESFLQLNLINFLTHTLRQQTHNFSLHKY